MSTSHLRIDAGPIAAQRVEHYKIAGDGCARTYAGLLGDQMAARLLQQSLDEERETDKVKSPLAHDINVKAVDLDGAATKMKNRIGRGEPKSVSDKLLAAVGLISGEDRIRTCGRLAPTPI